MVRVKDTQSFIARAREIHGDKYDYSQTVYTKSQKPITIICRTCGPFVLAEAGSHYGKKQCGCRFCEIETSLAARGRAKRCKCGKRLKYDTKTKCSSCISIDKERRAESRKVACKTCGQKFTPGRGGKFCSVHCRQEFTKCYFVQADCLVCGKQVKRRANELEVYGGACCSRKCQIQHALIVNRGKPRWRQHRLPVLYFCACGELSKRQQCTVCDKWIRRLESASKQALERFPEPSWMQIFNSMAAFHSKRVSVVSEYCEQQGTTKWSVALKAAEKRSLTSMSWREKLSNMAGNQRQRMQRKSQAKSSTVC